MQLCNEFFPSKGQKSFSRGVLSPREVYLIIHFDFFVDFFVLSQQKLYFFPPSPWSVSFTVEKIMNFLDVNTQINTYLSEEGDRFLAHGMSITYVGFGDSLEWLLYALQN